jgi:hypothetical protein
MRDCDLTTRDVVANTAILRCRGEARCEAVIARRARPTPLSHERELSDHVPCVHSAGHATISKRPKPGQEALLDVVRLSARRNASRRHFFRACKTESRNCCRLELDTTWWLNDRLLDTRLRLGVDQRLILSASNLLAYLAAYTVLDARGLHAELRKCRAPDCINTFEPDDLRMVYCSSTCQERHKKRRQRQRARSRRVASEEV